MTGLDKIISEIMSEAEKEAKGILDAAHAEAARVSEAAKQETEIIKRKIEESTEQKISEINAGFEVTLDAQNRRSVLARKQSLIAQTLQAAKEMLYGLPDGEYFDLLIKLAAKSAHAGQGVIRFNKRDFARLPQDFEAELNKALPQGSSLTVSGDASDIDGGIILQYGDIIENCSINAIFDARSGDFSDLVRGILFDGRD